MISLPPKKKKIQQKRKETFQTKKISKFVTSLLVTGMSLISLRELEKFFSNQGN
jgi:hypothetical protein